MKKYITVGELDNANAVLRYSVIQQVEWAEIEGPNERGWYEVALHCTMLQYERIFGFLEGLEYLQ